MAIVFALPAVPPLASLQEKSLTVDLLTPEQFAAIAHPPAEPAPAAVPPAPEAVPPAEPGPAAMIHATQMLSAGALADPRSRQAREMLPQLAPDERMVQLCGLEAMEQVHQWRPDFQPDALVSYALSDPVIAADGIRADGAAFRSRGNWYGIRFDCGVSPDHRTVVRFEFRVGDPVPKDEWEARNLTTKS